MLTCLKSSFDDSIRSEAAVCCPGGADEPMPTREKFEEALQHAQVIYDFVLNLLPEEARP
jgi:hypothetical protein